MLRAVANMVGGGFAGSFTTLTVSGQASFAAGTAAAPSVKVGGEQNGLYSDGTGSLSFATAGARVVRMGTVGGTGNYLRLDANNTPLITAVAGATNADIGIASAGTGSVLFATNGSISNLQWQVNHTASAVNYIQATGAATGNAPSFSVGGTDANVYFNYYTKGSGLHQFITGGGVQFAVGHVANAVNRVTAYGNATGLTPGLFAEGSDANVGLGLYSKAAGPVFTAVRGAVSAYFDNPASPVNYATITGSATGNAVTISASGSDSNIDFAIAPKGTGVLRFGTHSALAAETVTGYITIKDSAGNTRKLAVVS